jgi:hypothetical protein
VAFLRDIGTTDNPVLALFVVAHARLREGRDVKGKTLQHQINSPPRQNEELRSIVAALAQPTFSASMRRPVKDAYTRYSDFLCLRINRVAQTIELIS